jgi:hypothetical protein
LATKLGLKWEILTSYSTTTEDHNLKEKMGWADEKHIMNKKTAGGTQTTPGEKRFPTQIGSALVKGNS